MSIKLYVASVKTLLNKDLFDKAYDKAPNERKEKINEYQLLIDKIQSVGASMLLEYALNDYKKSDVKIDLYYNEYGKPFLKNGDIFFNISHSADYVVVGVADSNIGVDIEKIEENRNNVAKRFFSLNEYNDIINKNDDKLFYRYWTIKESFIKAKGLGLKIPLNSFTINIERDNIDDEYYYKEIFDLEGYAISVCVNRNIDSIEVKEVDLNKII